MVEISDTSAYNLDKELSASVKKILLKNITFKDAQIPDQGDMLNHKYKPLNGRYNLQHGTSAKANQIAKNAHNASSDIPIPPMVIFPAEKVELGWKEMRRIGPGLANLGNTCFLNSVLQVLTYTPPLVNYVTSGYHKSKCRIVGFCMQCELSTHLNRAMHNSQGGSIRPMSIIQKLQCIGKNFRFGRQEDAHEFLRYVVEGLQKSDYANKPKLDKLSRETTVANAIFGGYYRSQVKCMHCSYESNTFDPMMDLNMDIKDCSSIIQTLQKSVRPDRLDGENKYFCEKCRTKRVAQKRGNIHKEPNILTLVLKRFDFSKMFGGKISKDVSFTEELNIRPFMSNNQGEPVIYKLYGILVHSGYSCNSGHYYCYVKAANGTWYEMNDSRVCQVGLQTVLRAQAYILFYVKANQVKKVPKPAPSPASSNGMANNVPKASPIKVQKTELKSTLKESIKNSNDSGVLIHRKPEPKINWAHQKEPISKNTSLSSQKETLVKNTDPSNLPQPSSKNNPITSPKRETVVQPIQKSQIPCMKSVDNSKQTKPINSHKESSSNLPLPKIDIKNFYSMNSLQKLSEAYDDSDSVGSRASSPSSTQQDDSPTAPCKSEDNKTKKESSINTVNEKTNVNNDEKQSDTKHDSHESKPPFKLTLKTGKQFIHNKLNIWSPITKGTLYPRAILNKCMTEHENDHSKGHTKKKKMTDTSWKEEAITSNGRLFGPLMPPPPGMSSQESSSITSETSSASSIHNQSGEWDVLEKVCDKSSSNLLDSTPAGWNVSSTSNTPSIKSNSNQITGGVIDSKLLKKKKKKKKRKHKHRSEEIFSGQVEISIDKVGANDSRSDAKLENTLTHDSKKKKMQLQSMISLPLLPTSSSSEDVYRKKHKKKKKTISLTIDTNSNDIGKYLSYEVKNKSEIPSIDSKNVCLNVNGKDSLSETMNKSADNRELNSTQTKKETYGNESYKSPEKCNGMKPFKSFTSDERLPTKKKEVPIHAWDEQKKKQSNWDGSNKSSAMEHLLGGGPKVDSWDGTNKSYLFNIKKHSENTQDEWDEEYDKGKVKKLKRKIEDDYDNHKSKSNSFQDYQNYKNYNPRDKNPNNRSSKHYSDNRHYSKKRKVYSNDSRFA